jgi:hypothetical protein
VLAYDAGGRLTDLRYPHDGLGRRKTNQETVSGLPTLTYTYQPA